uniref:Uncharacterized protein n=1 Tax=Anguilla anguilla TaxID=7936 RepID=A0A0E9U651_ANGAN
MLAYFLFRSLLSDINNITRVAFFRLKNISKLGRHPFRWPVALTLKGL